MKTNIAQKCSFQHVRFGMLASECSNVCFNMFVFKMFVVKKQILVFENRDNRP